MFRLATVLTAATCLTPFTASAIKMSLSGETEFTVISLMCRPMTHCEGCIRLEFRCDP